MTDPARTTYLIKLLETETRLIMDSVLRIHGFTTTQYTAMSIIENTRTPYSSASLARRLRITPQSANETVTSLYVRKLVLKKPDPDVPRAKLITLGQRPGRTFGVGSRGRQGGGENAFSSVRRRTRDFPAAATPDRRRQSSSRSREPGALTGGEPRNLLGSDRLRKSAADNASIAPTSRQVPDLAPTR